MNPIKIVLIVWFALGMLSTVYLIDKPRTTMTVGPSIFSLVISAMIIVLILYI